MAFQPGYKAAFYMGTQSGALVNVSSYADSLSLPISNDALDVSTFGTLDKQNIPGMRGGDSIPVSGPLDTQMGQYIAGVLAAQYAGTQAFPFLYGPAGSVAGQLRFAGSYFVTNYTASVGVAGRVEYSASLQIAGAVTVGTF